jgi:hypothetical protein
MVTHQAQFGQVELKTKSEHQHHHAEFAQMPDGILIIEKAHNPGPSNAPTKSWATSGGSPMRRRIKTAAVTAAINARASSNRP